MKQRISKNISWKRYIYALISLILLYDVFRLITLTHSFSNRAEYELIAALIFAVFYYYFSHRKTLHYDEQYLYITSTYKKTGISLKNITKVSLTHTKINDTDTWKIHYINSENEKRNIRFIPNTKKCPECFEVFKAHVKTLNPEVKIENKANWL